MMATGTNPYAVSTETFSAATPFDQMAFATPDYSKAFMGMGAMFADLGKNLAIVEQGNRQLALDQQNFMLANRSAMHKETMELMQANRLAEEAQFNQSLEAMKMGIEMQKNRFTLQALQREADESFGVADYETNKHANYLTRFNEALTGNSAASLFLLSKEFGEERYMAKSEQGRQLLQMISQRIQGLPEDEASRVFMGATRGEIEAFQTMASGADAQAKNALVQRLRAIKPDLSEGAAYDVLSKSRRALSPEAERSVEEGISKFLAEENDRAFKLQEFDPEQAELIRLNASAEATRRRNTAYYPGIDPNTDPTRPTIKAIQMDHTAAATRFKNFMELNTATSILKNPEATAMSVYLNSSLPAETQVNFAGRTMKYGDMDLKQKVLYRQNLAIEEGENETAAALGRYAQALDKVATPEQIADMLKPFPGETPEQNRLRVQQMIESTQGQVSQTLKPPQPRQGLPNIRKPADGMTFPPSNVEVPVEVTEEKYLPGMGYAPDYEPGIFFKDQKAINMIELNARVQADEVVRSQKEIESIGLTIQGVLSSSRPDADVLVNAFRRLPEAYGRYQTLLGRSNQSIDAYTTIEQMFGPEAMRRAEIIMRSRNLPSLRSVLTNPSASSMTNPTTTGGSAAAGGTPPVPNWNKS